jgi:hypothetical protein
VHDNILFMHNGGLASDWTKMKRRMLLSMTVSTTLKVVLSYQSNAALQDRALSAIRGTTDSEHVWIRMLVFAMNSVNFGST